jgi:hypothetical protein
MTSKTQTFIDLDDITGLHVECLNCHAALTIPLSSVDREPPRQCPNCKQRWGTAEIVQPTQGFLRAFTQTLAALEQETAASNNVGFSLTLEISPDSLRKE